MSDGVTVIPDLLAEDVTGPLSQSDSLLWIRMRAGLAEAQDIAARTSAILEAAKVPPCDGDDREYFLDQRVQLLADELKRWQTHANRVDQIEMDQACELGDLKQQVERLSVKEWAADIRLAAKFAPIVPKDDEIDSVMSLLNWLRMNHDQDSAAREWLERVVATSLRLTKDPGAPNQGSRLMGERLTDEEL